jgi:hypothetical protein
MDIPQIRLHQTQAQLGLDIQKPVQEIQQPQADLNMSQIAATVEIRSARGILTIDTSEAQANIDLRGPLRRTQDYADFGKQRWLEAIAQISVEGDRLAAIEHKGSNPIAEIAFEDSGIFENTEIIADSTGGDGIEMNYQYQPIEFQVELGGVKADPEIHRPIHNYTRGKVEGYIRVKNSLVIDLVGTSVDKLL